jgi:hypothetical protein
MSEAPKSAPDGASLALAPGEPMCLVMTVRRRGWKDADLSKMPICPGHSLGSSAARSGLGAYFGP